VPTVEELAARIQQLEARLNNIGGQFDDNQTIRAGNVLLLNNEADTDGDPSDVGQDPEGNTRKGTGFFASKIGRVFAEGTFNAGTAYQGALQAGFNTAGKFLAAAGAWILDATGLNITGIDFIESHTGTVGSNERLARRGMQDSSGTPIYRIEFYDTTSGTNLITTNPGAESGSLTGWTDSGSAWAASGPANSGSYAFVATNPATSETLTSDQYTVNPSTSYTATAWLSRFFVGGTSPTSSVLIQVNWYTGAGAPISSSTIYAGGAGSHAFLEKTASVTSPATAGKAAIQIYFTSKSGSPTSWYIYIDDVSLVATVANYSALNFTDAGVTASDESQTSGNLAAAVTGPSSATDNAVARFDGATGKIIQDSSASISDAGVITTTGGDINGALVVNESGADKDMRVEGDTDQNLLFTDASADKVGIGTSAPATKLQVEGAVTLLESAAPSTPASNYGAIFQDTGSRPSAITDTALVGQLPIAVKATVNASATSGTGETVLATYTIPAGVLASAWDGVRITGKVDTTSGASTKTYRLRFGGASGTIIATGNTAGATRVRLGGWVWRTGAATQEAFGETLDAAGSITSTSSSPTQTLANAIDIVLTGQTTTAAHTVKNPMLMVEFLPMVNQ